MWLNATRGTTAQQASSGDSNSSGVLQANSPNAQILTTDENSDARSVKRGDSKTQGGSENGSRQQNQTREAHTQVESTSDLATTENSRRTTPATEDEGGKWDEFEYFLKQVKESFQKKQGGQENEQVPWFEELRTDLSNRFGGTTGKWKITSTKWKDCGFTEDLKNRNNAMKDCGEIEYTRDQTRGMIRVKYTWQGKEGRYEWELKVNGGSGGMSEYKRVVDQPRLVEK